ncbi:MAG TPA: alpha-galactosidase [Mycobacteriales bacterium]|nr:alpha-galactosidase [Mycobacteriales bacterium]HVX70678.1 alpha-galactosidase [Mycobacteriales bacterium]
MVGCLLLAGAAPAVAGPTDPDDALHSYRVGSAYVRVAADHAEIGDGKVSRHWAIGNGSVETTSLIGPGGTQWAKPGPDFRIDIGLAQASTTSTTGWSLASVKPVKTASAVGLDFTFAPLDAALAPAVTIERKVRLRPGRSTMSVTSTLHSLIPIRVPSYTLDQITPRSAALPGEVVRYREGSDWRNDFRVVSHPSGTFDAEGEILRRGQSAGFFLVSQRRGGLASRALHTSTGADAIGVDWARDLLDAGPLITDPPNYNTVGNPAYPVPLRARLVRPGETLQLGTAWTGVYAGPAGQGVNSAAAAFAAAFPWHIDRTVGANSFHPWSHGPDMSDANLRKQIDAAKKLGVERYMLDDQWQGGPGGESGDWQFDPARYPDRNHDGIPDFITYLHHQGMQLGLWMSPVEFNMHSVTYASHPAWGCLPLGDIAAQVPDDAGLGAWDATNPAFQSYLIGVVDRLVEKYDVREFKFDFMAWLDCWTHDYADYEDAFVSMVQRMERRHPHVTFELDETNDQRLWPFESEALGPSWFDNNHHHGIDQVSELLHDLWSAAPWMPTQTIGLGSFDSDALAAKRPAGFLMPLALLSHTTFWTDFTKLTPNQRRQVAWWDHWYSTHRDAIGPLDYELTKQDPAKGGWAVFEPWHGRSGYVFAFHQTGAGSVRVRLQGLHARSTYLVSDVRSGKVLRRTSGRVLQSGLTVRAPRAWSARVLRISRA